MEPADLPAARVLWEATAGMGMGAGDSPADLEAFLARNPGISVVAVAADGAIAGAVLGGHDGRRGALYHLAVRRDLRGTGLGRALAERCVESLRATGVGKVNILVFGDNEAGLAFWRHTGWRGRPDLRVLQVSFDAPGDRRPGG
jgi:putative acetyltransferase